MESLIPALYSSDARVTVGRFSYGTPTLKLWGECERISIGAFCSIADGVTLFAGGEHNTHWVTTYPLRIALGDVRAGSDGHPASKGETRIGNDVWIGHGATILSGVTIGDGAVIGACSVVASDVPAYHIVAGNPARILKPRFSDERISALQRIAWWNWPIERIQAASDLLCSAHIDKFIEVYDLPG